MNLRYIEELLRHKNYKTTVGKLKNPLDNLNLKQKSETDGFRLKADITDIKPKRSPKYV